MDARAILFDLDNTLYRERRFILSGFAAVARLVEDRHGVPACDAFRVLVRALRAGRRSTAFQELCDTYGLDHARIATWVGLVRSHAPRLRPGHRTRRMLADLRGRWKTGLVTNGLPDVQRRKIDSLRLRPLFDHICLAGLPGEGGKPAPEPFVAACAALGVRPERTVHVGDDVDTDVRGAQGAGLKTILVAPQGRRAAHRDADRVVSALFEVPAAAEALIQGA